ncbi:CAP domain-containing protein [Nannocystis pusilla]|uniref:CAP domain-containing protein n=1 Tax=Nannocystis pusilla TaxID=889268 RepID=A0ABS7U0S1_9BACT|nr:CAP domain-containing protein [Nannocystis pusilla]MBZ5714117.1 CAP domain-containing protein [Nannocystis pusilla]
MSEGTWSGAVAGCTAGDTGAPGRDNALRLVNLYRWLAGLPPVGHDAGLNAKAQQCALMMHAEGMLSHDPDVMWACYTAEGAQAAMNSNISATPGVVAVDLYMVDPGNATTFGHRRWILSRSLGPIGLGSTSVNSCMWVIGGQAGAGAEWTAWPPPGIVPLAAIHVPEVPWADVDETGWTIQSDEIDVGAAQVTIRENGVEKPVKLTTLQGGFGSSSAIAMTPQGWVSEAGKTYTVQVDGVPQPFSYEVQVVACP